MCAWVCVCMCVCMRACVHVCMRGMRACVRACVRVCACMCVYRHLWRGEKKLPKYQTVVQCPHGNVCVCTGGFLTSRYLWYVV